MDASKAVGLAPPALAATMTDYPPELDFLSRLEIAESRGTTNRSSAFTAASCLLYTSPSPRD